MSRDLLNKIRGAIDNNQAPEEVKPVESQQPVADSKPTKEPTVRAVPKKKPAGKQLNGFEELQQTLKAEKEGFTFNRRLVYIDDNIGEALDLLRKKAKINSNVLASYLLKQFLLENKELIKGLKEKDKGNMFLD